MTTTLKAGDRVRHKLANIMLTITKVSEYVAVCKRDVPEVWKFAGVEMETWTAICEFKNLEKVETTIPKSTFNVCHVCGKPIDKTDYCWAENIGDCKTGIRYGRFVTLQHHLKCNNPLAKSLW